MVVKRRNPAPTRRRDGVRRAGEGESLVDIAVEQLRDRILDLSIAPGSHIGERLLATRFGLSRTPTREAINRLAAEGLVELQPHRGAFVPPLDLTTIDELFLAARASERLAAHHCDFDDSNLVADIEEIQRRHREAVRRRSFLDVSRWHAASRVRLADATHNRFIADYCRRMSNQMRRLSWLVYRIEAHEAGFPDRPILLLNQLHHDLTQALVERDRARLMHEVTHQIDVFRMRVARTLTRDIEQEFAPD